MDDSQLARRARASIATALVAVAAGVAAGCSTTSMGTTATSFMNRVKESRDPNVRYVAYGKLGSPNCYDNEKQKIEAIRLLVERLESGREPIATRAIICRTLGDLHKPEAREALLKVANVPDTPAVVRAEACGALGKVGRTEDATVLARIMIVDTTCDCRIAAIEGLGELKANDSRINVLLVQGMEHDDPAIRLASLRALRTITGKDLGVEPGPWRTYFEKSVASAVAKDSKKSGSPRQAANDGKKADSSEIR
jgi:HEAT repeat protein